MEIAFIRGFRFNCKSQFLYSLTHYCKQASMIINGIKVISHIKLSKPGNSRKQRRQHTEKKVLKRKGNEPWTSLIKVDLKITTFWDHVGIQQPPNDYISLCFHVVQWLTFRVLPILDGLGPISFYGWDSPSPLKLNAGLFHRYRHSSRHWMWTLNNSPFDTRWGSCRSMVSLVYKYRSGIS